MSYVSEIWSQQSVYHEVYDLDSCTNEEIDLFIYYLLGQLFQKKKFPFNDLHLNEIWSLVPLADPKFLWLVDGQNLDY